MAILVPVRAGAAVVLALDVADYDAWVRFCPAGVIEGAVERVWFPRAYRGFARRGATRTARATRVGSRPMASWSAGGATGTGSWTRQPPSTCKRLEKERRYRLRAPWVTSLNQKYRIGVPSPASSDSATGVRPRACRGIGLLAGMQA